MLPWRTERFHLAAPELNFMLEVKDIGEHGAQQLVNEIQVCVRACVRCAY